MRFLGLSKGYYAIVDDEDYGRLRRWKWHVVGKKRRYYGSRTQRKEDPQPDRERLLHYEVLRLSSPLPGGRVIDHINGNPLDCRKANLRVCTREQNAWNRGAPRVAKTSQYKGVSYQKERPGMKGGWVATLKKSGKHYYLGLFEDEYAAVKAYNVAAYRMMGKYAYLNKWEGATRRV